MLFTDAFINILRDDPFAGAIAICNRIFSEQEEGTTWGDNDYANFLEGLALLQGMEAAGLISLPHLLFDPEMPGDLGNDCKELQRFFQSVQESCSVELSKSKFASHKAHFQALLGASFVYEFTQGDLDRIQELLGQLRTQIRDSDLFTDEHRRRLLLKLEKLQTELHKKMSSLDRLWGITGELGVVLGKFGDDAKPLVDRFKEIMQITWRTQSRAEDMPSDSPLPLGDDGKSLLSDTAD